MPKVTTLKKLKRLYLLSFDDENFESIYLTEDCIVKFMLSKGKNLTSKEVEELRKFASYSKGKNLAIYYLSFKTRTKKEVENYLLTQEIPTTDIEQILLELEKIHLINDQAYCQRYIETQLTLENYGPYQILQKLKLKGLDEELINEQLLRLFDESKEFKIAHKLAEKVIKAKSHQLPFKQLKIKISQALVAKGFSYSMASQVLDDLELVADEDNENILLEKEAEKVYQRLSRRYEGYNLKQRMSQALGRKGFDWSLISDILSHYDF